MKGLGDAELIESYEEGEKIEVRELARRHTKEAIQCLLKLMRAPKTPAGVKRQCAADIINQGWGRPDARGDGGDRQASGLTINILKLSTGIMEQITTSNEEMIDVHEAMDVATLIASENKKRQ